MPLVLAVMMFATAAGAQSPVALDCGTVADATVTPGLTDFFNFDGQAGDLVLVRLLYSTSDKTFQPSVTVVGPAGNVAVKPLTIALTLGATLAGQFSLVSTGQHQIQVRSSVAGSFKLVFTRLNRPCSSGTLSCGTPVTGRISGPLQMPMYQFGASAGDILSLRLAQAAPVDQGFLLTAVAYSPDGQVLTGTAGQQAAVQVSATPGRIEIPITTAGAVTLVVFDAGNVTGGYTLSVTRVNSPCGTKTLSCGSVTQGTLGAALAIDSYSIPFPVVSKGDAVSIRAAAADTGSSLQPYVEVWDPQGNRVNITPSPGLAAHSIYNYNFTAAAGGNYVVLVEDASGFNRGGYAVTLMRLNRPCGAQGLSCGSVVDGSLSGLLAGNAAALTAGVNDRYVLRLLQSASGSLFQPRVDIYDPQGNLFQSLSTKTGPLARQNFTTPAAGAYTLMVTDGFDGSQSGAYSLSLLRLNQPCNVAGKMTCGAPAATSLTRSLSSPVYTYDAAAGESFSVRMMDGTGALQPAVEVYDAQGNPAGQTIAGSFTGVDVTQPAAGTYSLVALDTSTRQAGGPFTLDVLRTVNACGASPGQGQTVGGVISAATPFVSYTIPASAGDMLSLRGASLTAGFSAQMDLYDPQGSRLDSATFQVSRKAAATGNYTAIVGAAAARTGGGYSLAWQLLNNPAGTSALACGGVNAASLTPANEFRYYTAAANAGDVMRLIFTRLSDNFSPQIELFDQNGARLAASSDITQKVAAAGNYLVVVSPSTSKTETGSYSVAYQRSNNPCSAAILTCGQTTLRQVGIPAQLDAFSFTGTGGDQANLRFTQRSGSYAPFAELYDGAGNRLASTSSGLLRPLLTASGGYTLLVRDANGVNTGSYRVTLQDETNACTVNDTEAPVVTLLAPTGGEVIAGGTAYRIGWLSDDNVGVATHDIALSTDGGQTFAVIAGGLSGNAQSYVWAVPPDIAPSRKAIIRVTATDAAGNAQSAASGPLSIIGSGFNSNGSATYTYDSLNRLIQVVRSDGRTIQYTWDAAGNLVQVSVSGQ